MKSLLGVRWFFLLMLPFLLPPSPARAALSGEQIQNLFEEGKALFRQANELAATDPEQAQNLYHKSALRFERIVREGDIHNGKLYYNIGNAYFRMKDIGRAILNYRRAQQYIPNDPNLIQNLEFARMRRTDRLEETSREKVLKTLFFWHYDLSPGTRSTLFAVSFVLLWVAAGLRLFFRRPFLHWIVGVSSLVSLFTLGSLLLESSAWRSHRPGVIVVDEVIARKGDSATYEPSFQEPLHAGTEWTLVESRGDWFHVELPDGRRCWLPRDAVELVR